MIIAMFIKDGKIDRKAGIASIFGFIVGGVFGYTVDFSSSTAYRIVSSGIDLTKVLANKSNYNKLLNDLEDFSDLDLSAERKKDGRAILTYERKLLRLDSPLIKRKMTESGQEYLKKMKRGNDGSSAARKILVAAIKSERLVDVSANNTGRGT